MYYLLTSLIGILLGFGGTLGYQQAHQEPLLGASILYPTGGGTGWGNIQSGTYLTGNGTGRLATSTCADITGSADLCDGSDATGGGGGSFPFSADTNYNQVVYSTSTPTLWFKSGLFASSTSQLLYASTTAVSATRFFGALTGNVTGNADTATALAADPSDCSAGSFTLGINAAGAAQGCTDAWTQAENTAAAYLSSVDISANTNLAATWPVILTGDTLSFGWATTSQPASSNLFVSNGSNGFYGVATSSATINSPLSGALTVIGSGQSLSIANAAADGSTKGAASFTAADFNDSSGNISLDYTNGQAASASLKGFLTSADWTTFNNKISSSSLSGTGGTSYNSTTGVISSFAYPFPSNATTTLLTFSGGASTTDFSANTLAVGGTATTSISSAGTLKIQNLSGVLIGTSGTVSAGVDGTDYTLVNAVSCTNQVVTALTAAGVGTCSSVSNAMLSNSTISGISLGSNLADLTATNSTLTFSGTYNGSTARNIGINLGTTNNWTNRLAVGTTTPWASLSISTSTANNLNIPLFAIASSSDANFFTVTGSNGYIGIGTTSPFARFTLTQNNGLASSSILVAQYNVATSTAKTIDCRDSNTIVFPIGTSATTITLAPMVGGQTCKVVVINPNASAGAITWAVTSPQIFSWANQTTPTQTTTANRKDVYSFIAIESPALSTTTPKIMIMGAASTNF